MEMFVKKVTHLGKSRVRIMVKNKKSVFNVGCGAAKLIVEIEIC